MLYSRIEQALLGCLWVFVAWCGCPTGLARAQAAASEDAGKLYVAFRMEAWTTKHLHDAAQVKTYVETLKNLGCEVRTNQHDGHTDVTCRTVFWKSLALDSSEQAERWIAWFRESGFETIHGHAVGQTPSSDSDGKPRELVQFRLAEWRSKHTHKAAELSQFTALCRGLGCEVETVSHGNHTDVKFRCPEWREVELPSHVAATSWQKFLGELGFEAKHEH